MSQPVFSDSNARLHTECGRLRAALPKSGDPPFPAPALWMWRSSDLLRFAPASFWRVGWRTSAWVSACATRRRTAAICWGAWSVRADFFLFSFTMSALRFAAWVLLLLGVLAA